MRATIESIWSQDYEGELEIVLCDDRSTDGTFAIMQEMAAAYTGRHKVIVHQAEKNGRVAVNMNIAVELSSHDWLMRVDGDDILHPDRARLTALAIMQHPRATAITGQLSPFSTEPSTVVNPPDADIEMQETDARDFDKNFNRYGIEWWGCMMTVSRRIFTEFGPLPAHCGVLDDTLFATRALMLGSFVLIKNGTLLYYRRHAGNISSLRDEQHSLRDMHHADIATRDYYRRGSLCHEAIMAELEHYASTQPEREELQALCRFFDFRFFQLRELAFFWDKPWAARRQIKGVAFLQRISYAIQTTHPYLYTLARWLKKKR